MGNMTGNPTYNITAMFQKEILQNHHSVMLTFEISLPEEDIDLPKLYWIPKLHKNPYKQRYIAGSANPYLKFTKTTDSSLRKWVDSFVFLRNFVRRLPNSCSFLRRFVEICVFTNKFPYIRRNIFVAVYKQTEQSPHSERIPL